MWLFKSLLQVNLFSQAGRIRLEAPLTDKCTHMGTGGAPNCVCGDGGVLIGPRGAGLQADSEEEGGILFHNTDGVVKSAHL